MVDVEKHNINADDSTDCDVTTISDDATDLLIPTAIDAGTLMGCADDDAGTFIAFINAGDSTDCADITISNNAADLFIYTAIYDEG